MPHETPGAASPSPAQPLSIEVTLGRDELARIIDQPFVRALMEQSSDGVIVIDFDTRLILATNRRARVMLGYGEESMVGRRCKRAVNSPDCDHHCLINAAVASQGKDTVAEVFYRGKDGAHQRYASTRVILVRDADGGFVAGVEIIHDHTRLRQFERALGERRSLHGIIGVSAVMQEKFDLLEQVAPFDLPVLITGESGVGKERFADALQYLSDRTDGPFVKVNCAAINRSLIESELFGHRRGAFTGATRDRRGSFEEADGGTILLDEVGELPLDLQPKLLRVIQQGEVQRVGDDRPRKVDVRVLAATNVDIEDAVRDGRFREDLYYRLAGVRLHIPPLREHLDDLPLLVDHFLLRFTEEAERRGRPHQVAGVSDQVLDALTCREWRGNVRELANVLRLAWIRTPEGAPIRVELLDGLGGVAAAPVTPVVLSLAQVEARAIRQAMAASDGNLTTAAKALGINRSTLWRKLKKSGVS